MDNVALHRKNRKTIATIVCTWIPFSPRADRGVSASCWNMDTHSERPRKPRSERTRKWTTSWRRIVVMAASESARSPYSTDWLQSRVHVLCDGAEAIIQRVSKQTNACCFQGFLRFHCACLRDPIRNQDRFCSLQL